MSNLAERFKGRDVVSVLDFTREELEYVFKVADRFLNTASDYCNLLKGRLLALAFFEPSTRTRLSFEAAMLRLGGSVIGFTSEEATSVAKGERFSDTIRMLDSYADAIVIRHRYEGAAKLAADIAERPVINAGDGRNEHPTQAMLDIYTMYKVKGDVGRLTIGVMGDLKYARVVNSLLYALTIFKPKKVYLISHPLLRLRDEVRRYISSRSVNFEEVGDINEVISELDVLYVTRIQKERFPDPMEYEKVRGSYRVTLDLVRRGKEDLLVMHPLPRVDELDPAIDNTKYAGYFIQASLGVPLRSALLALLLGGIK